ncbi:hypothetical protein G5714_004065 [Onychostoma macrolepis]|uniref:Uncharacterized protein n=1 Tax=Onychostoma macrolepis TaxID=369639 RepID=A0A7J6DB68_9TELE|nr:hypothetical protein G5714_004065 [Onychostoma macrolepis]
MDIINVSCAEIQTSAGFLYVILPVLLNHTNNPDCEQSWLSEDKRLIADPVNPQGLIAPVISVSSDRLVTSHCVNLNHEIICDSADRSHFSHVTAFRVRNQTAATPNSVRFRGDFRFGRKQRRAQFGVCTLSVRHYLFAQRIQHCGMRLTPSADRHQLQNLQNPEALCCGGCLLFSSLFFSSSRSVSCCVKGSSGQRQASFCIMNLKSESMDPESAVQTQDRSDDHRSLNKSESERINGSR